MLPSAWTASSRSAGGCPGARAALAGGVPPLPGAPPPPARVTRSVASASAGAQALGSTGPAREQFQQALRSYLQAASQRVRLAAAQERADFSLAATVARVEGPRTPYLVTIRLLDGRERSTLAAHWSALAADALSLTQQFAGGRHPRGLAGELGDRVLRVLGATAFWDRVGDALERAAPGGMTAHLSGGSKGEPKRLAVSPGGAYGVDLPAPVRLAGSGARAAELLVLGRDLRGRWYRLAAGRAGPSGEFDLPLDLDEALTESTGLDVWALVREAGGPRSGPARPRPADPAFAILSGVPDLENGTWGEQDPDLQALAARAQQARPRAVRLRIVRPDARRSAPPAPLRAEGEFGRLLLSGRRDPDRLRLRALLESGRPAQGVLAPGTMVRFQVEAREEGYLFLVNYDDTGAAQLVSWGEADPETAAVDDWLDAAHIAPGPEFEVGRGTLASRTVARTGWERWRALLFRDRAAAAVFLRARSAPGAAPGLILCHKFLGGK